MEFVLFGNFLVFDCTLVTNAKYKKFIGAHLVLPILGGTVLSWQIISNTSDCIRT